MGVGTDWDGVGIAWGRPGREDVGMDSDDVGTDWDEGGGGRGMNRNLATERFVPG